MPQASEGLRSIFPGGMNQAIKLLTDRGYILTKDFRWIPPSFEDTSEEESNAINYLVHEWDFGGLTFR